eukprot:gene13167-20329_t
MSSCKLPSKASKEKQLEKFNENCLSRLFSIRIIFPCMLLVGIGLSTAVVVLTLHNMYEDALEEAKEVSADAMDQTLYLAQSLVSRGTLAAQSSIGALIATYVRTALDFNEKIVSSLARRALHDPAIPTQSRTTLDWMLHLRFAMFNVLQAHLDDGVSIMNVANVDTNSQMFVLPGGRNFGERGAMLTTNMSTNGTFFTVDENYLPENAVLNMDFETPNIELTQLIVGDVLEARIYGVQASSPLAELFPESSPYRELYNTTGHTLFSSHGESSYTAGRVGRYYEDVLHPDPIIREAMRDQMKDLMDDYFEVGEEREEEMESEEEVSLMTSLAVAAGLGLILGTLTVMGIMPLKGLQEDMERVASMQLEDVPRSLSLLGEIESMQSVRIELLGTDPDAVGSVIDNGEHELKGLGNHRLYLLAPSVFKERLTDEAMKYEVTIMGTTPNHGAEHSNGAGCSHSDSGSKSKHSSRGSRNAPLVTGEPIKRTGLFLQHLEATVAFCKLLDTTESKSFEACNQVIRCSADAALLTDGTMLGLCGNNVILAWNTMKTCRLHATAALQFATELQRRCRNGIVRVGVVTGSMHYGNVGTISKRFSTVMGVPVTVASLAADLCTRFKTFCLVADMTQHNDLTTRANVSALLRLVDIWIDSAASARRVFLYELLTHKLKDIESLWEALDDTENMQHNTLFKEAMAGSEPAVRKLKKMSETDGTLK